MSMSAVTNAHSFPNNQAYHEVDHHLLIHHWQCFEATTKVAPTCDVIGYLIRSMCQTSDNLIRPW
jgi:hypothetical protein